MPNEPLKGVAPQMQVPRSAVPQQPAVPQASVPATTQPVAPEAIVPQAPAVEPMKERTQENFEKLIESNQKLFQANNVLVQQILAQQQRQQMPGVPTTPTQPPAFTGQQGRQQPKVDPNDFVERDPQTGEQYINEQKLRSALSEIQQRAIRAEDTANQFMQAAQQREKETQEREAFNSYPELNPRSANYDKRFERDTRAFLTDSMLNPNDYNGRPLTFKEAADLIRAGVQPTQQQVTQAAVAQVAEQQAANAAPTANQINKEQASVSIASQPPQAQADITAEQLQAQRLATRMGDETALAERLMHTDHIFGPNSGSGERPQ